LQLAFLLIIILVLALLCTWLRKKAVRWLFTLLAIVFWIAFLALLGFVVGYSAGEKGFHITKLLFH
jgi:cytosine/uracil/thiamine/allantoin permease